MIKFYLMGLHKRIAVLTILLSLVFAVETVNLAGQEFRFYASDGEILATDSQNTTPYALSGSFKQSRSPDAVVVGDSIYLVWENAGKIMFRSYNRQAGVWTPIVDISGEGCIRPKVTGWNNTVFVAWLHHGEAVVRVFDRGVWGTQETISAEANARLGTLARNSSDLAVIADSRGGLHAVWANNNQLLHRTRHNGVWSGNISRLSADYQRASGFPALSIEQSQVFISYMEKGLLVTNRYNIDRQAWEQTLRQAAQNGQRSNNNIVPGGPTDGPLLELNAIQVDSMFLHSPQPDLLYYGGMLQESKEFIIRGTVRDRGRGIRQITFSPAFGRTPPPLMDFHGGEWAVRYFIQSTDEPADIVITAYDFQGNASSRTIAVRKDITPPSPPTWVRIQTSGGVFEEDGKKKSSTQRVTVTWTDGTDSGSGIRYHVLGTNPRWWQNAVHKSGAVETAAEGENTFYVFAVDNVGNVSLPGTDMVFVDSIPPAAPVIFNTATSVNYFYGTCSEDVVAILVNGERTPDMEITSPGFWRYKHSLQDGRRGRVRLQAIDGVKNKSPVVEYLLEVTRTPPQVFYAEHNADGRALRIRDTVLITARAEPNCTAFFSIAGVTVNVPMQADSRRGRENIYTGTYTIESEHFQGLTDISVVFYDRVGNKTEVQALKPLFIDSWTEQIIDTFEDRGDFYPWKNHARARNITALEQTGLDLQIPEGQGVLQVHYDLAGRQTWAGITSREFLPRNYYGSQPALQFWLKGSGSPQARLVIQLLSKDDSLGLNNYDNDRTYSVSLGDTQWKKYSLLLPRTNNLDSIVKYAIYVHNPDTSDSGAFYLDDLRIVYHRPLRSEIPPRTSSLPVSGVIAMPVFNPVLLAAAPAEASEMRSPGGALIAPYLELELTPSVLTRGKKQSIKVTVPPGKAVTQVYVVWGRVNQKLQTTRLTSAGGNVFRGEYTVPIDLQTGELSGVVFVQTADEQLYKKPFFFKVLGVNSTDAVEQINAQFFPHPLMPGKDIQVKVSIPASIKSQQVMIFLGQDQSNVISTALSKNRALSAGGQEVWQGVLILPEGMKTGEYTANIFCKTQNGSFIKKRVKYSVQE